MVNDSEQNLRKAADRAEVVIQKDVHKKWQSYVWDTLDKSPEERKFLFKLDFALLSFASLGRPSDFEVSRIYQG